MKILEQKSMSGKSTQKIVPRKAVVNELDEFQAWNERLKES